MSLLQPVVDKLFADQNVVSFDPHGHRHPFTVLAVALFTFNDVPKQVVFCKDYKGPLMFTNELVPNPASRDPMMVQGVNRFDEAEHALPSLQGMREDTTADDLFARLLSGHYDRYHVKLLEFLPVKEIFPTFFSNAGITFDGVDRVLGQDGMFYFPKMMVGLEYVGDEKRYGNFRAEVVDRKHLDFGNILMWMQDGSIHWVTRREGDTLPVSLGTVGHMGSYNDFIQWSRQFYVNGWGVRNFVPMPYNLPKDEHRGGVRGAHGMGKPREMEPGNPKIVSVLQEVLNAETKDLDHATMVMLGAIINKHVPEPKVDMYAKYEALLERTIDEYMIILDGVGAKKRAEIKAGLVAMYMKRYRETFPEVK